jgi:pheromone shutdown protein TraB
MIYLAVWTPIAQESSSLISYYLFFIGERDAFMARSLATSKGKKIVGVVGMAHMDGIERNLLSRKFTVIKRNCPPGDAQITKKKAPALAQ